jgi:hypothetical protein
MAEGNAGGDQKDLETTKKLSIPAVEAPIYAERLAVLSCSFDALTSLKDADEYTIAIAE